MFILYNFYINYSYIIKKIEKQSIPTVMNLL